MERADDTGDRNPEDKTRRAIAVGFTLAVHAAVFAILSSVPEKQLAIPKAPIPVNLVIVETSLPAEAETDSVPAKETTVETRPVSPPPVTPDRNAPAPLPTIKPQAEPPEIVEESVDEISPEPQAAPPLIKPLSILSTQDSQFGDPIPEKWRLPHGASIPLDKIGPSGNPTFAALTRALDCLGFDADCAKQRKVVFSEDQLTGTDLVWMPTYAHSGLSNSDLFGMSEDQIRDRLGIPTAGKNGLMIFPGIAIDGPWWDALHGVNKACDYGIGINDLGAKQLMKRCKPLKPTSRDKIAFIPMPNE